MAGTGRLPLGRDARLLTSHPCGLWAVSKPPGQRSHPNSAAADPGALLTVPYDAKAQCYREGERTWFLLHRLDAPTSGVVLLADNAPLAARLQELFAERAVEKTYLALVKGRPPRREELWKDHLRTERRQGALRSRVEAGGGDLALAEVKLLASAPRPPLVSLLELRPQTGRTHQLRLQCAARQLPIVGDATYGDFRFNRAFAQTAGTKRLFLHAQRLAVSFDWEGQRVRLRAEDPVPPEFPAACR
jgi:tRNA pseudouridine65 synthase